MSVYKQNAPTTPFGFLGGQGYHTDIADSGLMLLGNRYYDSGTGRFLSQDPVGDGDNWYAYCDNDPLDFSDPTGLSMNGSCPYAPINTGASLSTWIKAQNGFDNDKLGAVDKWHRSVLTTTTEVDHVGYKSGSTRVDYGPWIYDGDTGGNFQLVHYSPLGKFSERIASAEKSINNILAKGIAVHIVGGMKQIDDFAGHRMEMIRKFGHDFQHAYDLQTYLNGLRKGVKTLERYGGPQNRKLIDKAQDAIDQIEGAFKGGGI